MHIVGALTLAALCCCTPGCSRKATPEPLPVVLETGYRYNTRQNAITGVVRNNTDQEASLVRVTFTMTACGMDEGKQIVDLPDLKPHERRPFHDVGPPAWRQSHVDEALARPVQSALMEQ